jgi:hypothetical protein
MHEIEVQGRTAAFGAERHVAFDRNVDAHPDMTVEREGIF